MSQPSGTIAVGVDGSESAGRALDWAIAQASAEHRALTLVHGLGAPSSSWLDLERLDPAAADERRQQLARASLAQARVQVRELAPGLEVHEIVEFVDPRDLLVEQSGGAAMVVVGSRGGGTVRSALMGSVSLHVARHSACPVVIHRPDARTDSGGPIVVAADGTPESAPVLEFAFRQAELTGRPLTAIHCFYDYAGASAAFYSGGVTLAREPEELELSHSLTEVREKYPDVSVTERVAYGVPGAIVTTVGASSALTVVGRHECSILHELVLGSVAVQVVENAHSPVAVIPVGARESARG